MIRHRYATIVPLFAAWVFFFAAAVHAQQERILDVGVEGTHTVAEQTVLAKVQIKPGMLYNEAAVTGDIRRIFSLGYFTDVQVEVRPYEEGIGVYFLVVEKPTIELLQIDGGRKLRKKKLLELLEVSEGDLYDPRKLKSGIDRITDEYKRKGYSESTIVSRIEEDLLDNTVNVYIAIDEGSNLKIGRVLVEGNTDFSDRKIQRLIKSKRRWFFFKGVYNEAILREDVERVRAFYRKNGYQDVEIGHEIYEAPSGKHLYVHLIIDEGAQYRVGDVSITGAVLYPQSELIQLLRLKPGEVYNIENLQEDLRNLKQYYGDRGYIHAAVSPTPNFRPDEHRVDMVYHIVEDEIYYVGRLHVKGNVRTKDEVVRREFRLFPGDRYEGDKIRRSIDRLYNLGYFEQVAVDTVPSDEPYHEDLVVEVQEARTGSFSFGGGFSSIDRLVGMIELEQRNFDITNWKNFTGGGQDLRLRMEMGTIRRYFDLSFTDPWILGYPVLFGVDLYNRTRLRSENVGLAFEEERRGVGLRLGKEFLDRLHVGTGYTFYRTEISNVVADASADLKAEEGKNDISMGKFSVSFDRRDNRMDPYDGYYLFSSLDVAGGPFGADKDFVRLQAGASHYWKQNDGMVLELRTRGGVVEAYGSTPEVPIFERFFGGGSGTVRGYRERHVGPRDTVSKDPIGGEAMFAATIEEVITLVRDERDRAVLRGSVFYDIGNVWRRAQDFGESFKSSVGFGARVRTPVGPLQLDLGYPLNTIEGEKQKFRIHFNVSQRF